MIRFYDVGIENIDISLLNAITTLLYLIRRCYYYSIYYDNRAYCCILWLNIDRNVLSLLLKLLLLL